MHMHVNQARHNNLTLTVNNPTVESPDINSTYLFNLPIKHDNISNLIQLG